MTTVSYSNQIANLIAKYLPYTDSTLGDKYQAQSFSVETGKMTMTFDSQDYSIISSIINDVESPNSVFTITGFYLKNNITSFEAYPEDSSFPYGFKVVFDYPHKLKKGQTITLKGFADNTYNIEYSVMKSENSYEAYLYTELIPIATVETGLGYIPVQYTEGLNDIQIITDEGSNQISFTFDENLYFVKNDINDIDTDFLPYLTYYGTYLVAINATTFFQNLSDSSIFEYLIIDTSSLNISPIRSTSNTSDSAYNSYSRSGYFDSNNAINLVYVLERNEDDVNNQTKSGSDIDLKQIEMFDQLTSILRTPLNGDLTKILSSMTITNSFVDQDISEGRVVITYEIQFKSSYQNSIMLEIEATNSYPINSINYNENIIDLT